MCDVLYMMFVDGYTVALKHNPVRAYNHTWCEYLFAPLIREATPLPRSRPLSRPISNPGRLFALPHFNPWTALGGLLLLFQWRHSSGPFPRNKPNPDPTPILLLALTITLTLTLTWASSSLPVPGCPLLISDPRQGSYVLNHPAVQHVHMTVTLTLTLTLTHTLLVTQGRGRDPRYYRLGGR